MIQLRGGDIESGMSTSGRLLPLVAGNNRPKAGGRLCYTSTQRWASCLAEMEEAPLLMVAFRFAPPYAVAEDK